MGPRCPLVEKNGLMILTNLTAEQVSTAHVIHAREAPTADGERQESACNGAHQNLIKRKGSAP